MYDIIQGSYDETLYCHTTRYHADFYDIIHPPHLRCKTPATSTIRHGPTSQFDSVFGQNVTEHNLRQAANALNRIHQIFTLGERGRPRSHA